MFDSGAEDVDEDEVSLLDVRGGMGGNDEGYVGEWGGEATVAAEEGDGAEAAGSGSGEGGEDIGGMAAGGDGDEGRGGRGRRSGGRRPR